jgi:hypothetical protein
MPIGPPVPPSPSGPVPGPPASPSPPVLPPVPIPPGSGSGALQPRAPIITRVDYAPRATAAGGFIAAAPASNLLIPRPQLTAIAAGGNVSFTVTLAATANIGLIYFQNLVADVSATISVSAGSYSATKPVYPSDFSGFYDQFEFERLGRPRFFVVPLGVSASTSTVDVTISGSIIPVQVGYMGICSVWQAPIGQKFGWGITIKDLSTLDRVTYGSPYVTRKQGLRVLSLGWDFLVQGGVYANVSDQVFAGPSSPFQAAVIAGKSSPIAGVPFPDDTDNLERLSVAGFSNTDQPFTNPLFATWDTFFSIEQM